ncbi:MAG: helix-turn-helix domain-containing protein [Candidatus Accumulibacter sp. UW26]|jgi:cytoskeleton protein RodZ
MSEQSPSSLSVERSPAVAGFSAELATTSTNLGVGPQLRAAREARNMSLGDAAQSLKLGPRQVLALEAEDWESLPGNTMIRGFVRNYARLLHLDADALMRSLDAAQLQQKAQLEVSAGTAASLPQAAGRRAERRDYLAILGGLLLLGLALLAYFFVPADLWRSQLSSLVEDGKSASVAGGGSRSSAGEAAPAAPGSVTVLAPQATVLADPSASAPPSGNGLKLSFAEPAWVEIRDARGQILLSELSPAGSVRELDGQPPFALVVGNSTHVSVQYRGRVIDLAPHSKAEVARLTLE